MKHALTAALLGLMTAASLTVAQNARTHSLGGSYLIDDIGNVISQPAFMNDYKDAAQVSGAGASAGVLIGIKALGDVLSLGTIANQGSMVGDDFYSRGIAVLNPVVQPDLSAGGFPPIPHLLVGLDLGGFKLGVDAFVELRNTRYNEEVTSTGGNQTTESKGRIYDLGVIANAIIGLGDVKIIPTVGIGRPGITGSSSVDDGTGVVTAEASSDKGIFARGGLEIDVPLFDLTGKAGAMFQMEKYRFQTKTGTGTTAITTTGDEYTVTTLDGYFGLVGEVADDLLFVGQYTLGYSIDKSFAEAATSETTTRTKTLAHHVGLGLERPVGDIWIFDELIPRVGLSAYLARPLSSTTVEADAGDSETKIRSSNTSQVSPTVGLGVTKGSMALDVSVDIGNWSGVFTGPAVVMGSLMVDFGKSGSSSGSYTPPAPTPTYSPTF